MNEETLDFFNRNKDLEYIPPLLPTSLSNSIDIAEWIMSNPQIAWIELEIKFNLDEFKKELLNVEKYYIPHRDDGINQGWESCCLHGIGIDKTQYWKKYIDNEDFDIYQWTEIGKKTPKILEFWKNRFPIQNYERIRFMKLKSKGFIAKHSDYTGMAGYNPLIHGCSFNLAIDHPKDCYMVIEGFGIVPIKEGKLFFINTTHKHALVNFSNQDRIHMIGTGLIEDQKNEFSDLVTKSYITQFKDI
jgi:hypothetical protein